LRAAVLCCSRHNLKLSVLIIEQRHAGDPKRTYFPMINESDIYRQNADNCMQLAEAAQDEAAFKRFKRMEAAWLALAEEQDWLDGGQSPTGSDDGLKAKRT
jgi:hypothetical protein